MAARIEKNDLRPGPRAGSGTRPRARRGADGALAPPREQRRGELEAHLPLAERGLRAAGHVVGGGRGGRRGGVGSPRRGRPPWPWIWIGGLVWPRSPTAAALDTRRSGTGSRRTSPRSRTGSSTTWASIQTCREGASGPPSSTSDSLAHARKACPRSSRRYPAQRRLLRAFRVPGGRGERRTRRRPAHLVHALGSVTGVTSPTVRTPVVQRS